MRFDNFGFFTEENGFPEVFRLIDMGIEQRKSSDYYYDNRNRPLYNGYVFQYTLAGKGDYEYKGVHYEVPEGSGFFTRIPEESSYGLIEKTSTPWTLIYIHFTGHGVEDFYGYYQDKVGPVCSLSPNSEALQRLMSLHEALCKGKELTLLEGSMALSGFLHDLLAVTTRGTSTRSEHVTNGVKLLDEQVEKSEGIDQVAAKLRISHAHFSRLFKEEMGMTPIDYLRKKRLQKGIHLLLNTNDSVELIARQCGFSCGNYFSKVFHHRMGISPNTYRKLHR